MKCLFKIKWLSGLLFSVVLNQGCAPQQTKTNTVYVKGSSLEGLLDGNAVEGTVANSSYIGGTARVIYFSADSAFNEMVIIDNEGDFELQLLGSGPFWLVFQANKQDAGEVVLYFEEESADKKSLRYSPTLDLDQLPENPLAHTVEVFELGRVNLRNDGSFAQSARSPLPMGSLEGLKAHSFNEFGLLVVDLVLSKEADGKVTIEVGFNANLEKAPSAAYGGLTNRLFPGIFVINGSVATMSNIVTSSGLRNINIDLSAVRGRGNVRSLSPFPIFTSNSNHVASSLRSGGGGGGGSSSTSSSSTSIPVSLLLDIQSGAGNSSPQNMTDVNGTLFFTADDGANGIELWKSDGTVAGTILVKNIHTSGDSNPSYLTAVGSTLFFSADDGTNGAELWKSDGTSGGTVMVENIRPNPNGANIEGIVEFNGFAFFGADDDTNGRELWKSDGTTTTLVKDIYSGGSDGRPRYFFEFDGNLYFTADTLNEGSELWVTDGGTAGTELVKDLYTGSISSTPRYFAELNGSMYFRAQVTTYGITVVKSDGTTGGTANVKTSDGVSNASGFTPANDLMFFTSDEDGPGTHLWKTDGTNDGTSLVKKINPSAGSGVGYLTALGDILYFGASDGTDGNELWESDGTASNTKLVIDINPGSSSSSPANLTNFDGALYFSADDGTYGTELWQSDGTQAGTTLVKDINSGASGSSPANFIDIDGTLFFSADNGTNGVELWIYRP